MPRWVASFVVLALALAGCAPPNQGAGESPSDAAASAAASPGATQMAQPSESAGATEGAEPPADYYDDY